MDETLTKLRESSNYFKESRSAIVRTQSPSEPLFERPHTLVFKNVINRGSLGQGRRDAGFDNDGSERLYSFREPRMDIVFLTGRHGTRVIEAFHEKFPTPWEFKKITATSKHRPAFDEGVDVFDRDPVEPVPEVQRIRDSIMKAFGFADERRTTCIRQSAIEPATELATGPTTEPITAPTTDPNTEPNIEPTTDNREDEEDVAKAVIRTLSHNHPTNESQQIATWVEDEVRFVLIRQFMGKRKRDETDAEHFDGNNGNGHGQKRQRLYD